MRRGGEGGAGAQQHCILDREKGRGSMNNNTYLVLNMTLFYSLHCSTELRTCRRRADRGLSLFAFPCIFCLDL